MQLERNADAIPRRSSDDGEARRSGERDLAPAGHDVDILTEGARGLHERLEDWPERRFRAGVLGVDQRVVPCFRREKRLDDRALIDDAEAPLLGPCSCRTPILNSRLP